MKLSRRSFLVSAAASAPFINLSFLFAATADARDADQYPNIVVILSDDLGYGSVNSYGASKNHIRTPNIDHLAREGRRFTDASTPSSVCTPTRYGLLTGRYCWRTSLRHGVLGTRSPLRIETTCACQAGIGPLHY